MAEKENEETRIIELARKTIEKYVETGQKIAPPEKINGVLSKKRGVFVTIKKNGDLRGCIGTTSPTQENVAQEIIRNAVSACSKDPRFQPVQPEELDNLEISVDILGEQESVSSMKELDPRKYGVIVRKRRKTGLLLPDLEDIDTVEKQVNIAKRKAGIPVTDSDIELFRFQVHRYEE